MNKYAALTLELQEELKKLTTPVSFDTWLKPLEIHHMDEELKIAYFGIKKTKGIEINFILNGVLSSSSVTGGCGHIMHLWLQRSVTKRALCVDFISYKKIISPFELITTTSPS